MQIKNILLLKFKQIPKEILYLTIAFLCIIVIGVAAQTITKGTMGKQDMQLEGSGVTTSHTFTRTTNSGYNITLNKVDWPGIDVLMVYGGGVNRTSATLNSAITGWGTASNIKFWIAPGSWTISADVTFPENITVEMADGAVFAIATGETVVVDSVANFIATDIFACISGTTTGFSFTHSMGIKSSKWTNSATSMTFTIGNYLDVEHLTLQAGSALAGHAPLKFVTGTLLTTPEDGAIEYSSPSYYFVSGTTRWAIVGSRSGTTTPTETPARQGDIYVDNTLKVPYIASGIGTPSDWQALPGVQSGTTTPTTTPTRIGDIFVDTTASKVFISKATAASTDWLLLN